MEKLKKVTVKVEVLMEEGQSLDGMNLTAIERESMYGNFSYSFETVDEEIIEGRDVCEKACNAQGTDIDFFFYEE